MTAALFPRANLDGTRCDCCPANTSALATVQVTTVYAVELPVQSSEGLLTPATAVALQPPNDLPPSQSRMLPIEPPGLDGTPGSRLAQRYIGTTASWHEQAPAAPALSATSATLPTAESPAAAFGQADAAAPSPQRSASSSFSSVGRRSTSATMQQLRSSRTRTSMSPASSSAANPLTQPSKHSHSFTLTTPDSVFKVN